MKFRSYVLKTLYTLLLPAFCLHCQSRQNQDAVILAEYDDIRITRSDFERSYYNFWQQTEQKDSPKLRRRFLRQLIEQQLIAREAKRQQLDTLPRLQKQLNRDLKRFVRRRLLEKAIGDTIALPDDQTVRRALRRQNRQMYVAQIFATKRGRIDSLYHILHDERAAAIRLFKPLGWIGWGDTDWPVEQALYRLKAGQISRPVQSLMGWHIFRIDSIRQTMRFNEPRSRQMENMRRRIHNRKFDMAAARFTRQLLWEKSLVINVPAIRQVWKTLAPYIQNQPANIGQPATPLELDPLQKPLAKRVLATVDDRPFRVNQFWQAVPNLPRNLLRPNLKKAVEIAVRDSVLSQYALERDYDRDPVVREKWRRQRITYLYYAALYHSSDSLDISRADLRAYYHRRPSRFVERIETEIYELSTAHRDTALMLARKLQQGADFAELARKYSQIPSEADCTKTVSSADGKIGQRASRLEPGQVYAPIKTERGYSVIRAVRRDTILVPFEEAEQQVRKKMIGDRWQTVHRSLLPVDYKAEKIQYNNDKIRTAFQTRQTVF